MSELQSFVHEDFGQIRVIEQNGELWFVAVDICKALEIANTTDALGRLDEDERVRFNLGHPMYETNCVNEPGLYSLVLGNRKLLKEEKIKWIRIHKRNLNGSRTNIQK